MFKWKVLFYFTPKRVVNFYVNICVGIDKIMQTTFIVSFHYIAYRDKLLPFQVQNRNRNFKRGMK
jgi:hypothetical protein